MLNNRVLSYIKSEARNRARLTGEVCAADIRNVMRSHVAGKVRGGLVATAFRDLVKEGFLSPTWFTETNPVTGHQVRVYRLS